MVKMDIQSPELRNIFAFLQAARGNWRNAVYLTCRICPYGKKGGCGDFLFSVDRDGTPVMVTVHDMEALSCEQVDSDECLAEMEREQFSALYSPWLCWHVQPYHCPFLTLLRK